MPRVKLRHGALAIPADIREELGVHDGDELESRAKPAGSC